MDMLLDNLWHQEQTLQEVIKRAVFLRYSLIHYLYTTFGLEYVEDGLPIMRPMLLEFPEEENLLRIESQFMFGSSLLFAPKLIPRES